MRHFQSEPMKIGKHLWRIAVEDFPHLGKNCTVYEWIRISPYPEDMEPHWWMSYKDWKGYNSNDTYSGLPRGLHKLWKINKPKYRHLMDEDA